MSQPQNFSQYHFNRKVHPPVVRPEALGVRLTNVLRDTRCVNVLVPVDDVILESTAMGVCSAPVNAQQVGLIELRDTFCKPEIRNVLGTTAHGHLKSEGHILLVVGKVDYDFSEGSPSAMVMP